MSKEDNVFEKANEISLKDRIMLFQILQPNAHWDAECYIGKSDWDWEDVLHEFHIPKFRDRAHFITQIDKYIIETKQDSWLKGVDGSGKKIKTQTYECERYHLLDDDKDLKVEDVLCDSDGMVEIKQKIIQKWDALGFLEGLESKSKQNIAELYQSEAIMLLNEEVKWAVYIVECSDGTLYTGISNDVNKRILTHNKGKGAKYTKTRLPVTLEYVKPCEDRSEASKEEYRIKKLTRKQKIELINEFKRSKGMG